MSKGEVTSSPAWTGILWSVGCRHLASAEALFARKVEASKADGMEGSSAFLLGAALGGVCPLGVEPMVHVLARLEHRDQLLGHRDHLSIARVSSGARLTPLDPKSPEAAQFDASPTRERLGHRGEDRVDDLLHVPLVQVRVLLGDPLNQFRLEHSWLWSRDLGVLLSGRSRICCESPRSEQHRAKKEAPRRALWKQVAGHVGAEKNRQPTNAQT